MIVLIDSMHGPYYKEARYQMEIDLKWVAENAGKRVKVYSYHKNKYINYVAYPMKKVKLLLRLIYIYTDDSKRKEITEFLTNYPKLIKIWRKLP